jgi:prepilin-type N-terminal cleavage/methylation domain-containing protein
MNRPRIRSMASRGMTLLELLFVVAIMGIVVAGITKAMVDLDKTSRVRNLNVSMQGEGRDALQVAERDIRQASLGATLGLIWTQDSAGNVVQRPSVQIFDGPSGTGANLDVKAGTDALLLVGSWNNGAQAAAQGTQYNSTQTLVVTRTAGFAAGARILAGPYREASWALVASVIPAVGVTPGGLNLSTTQNVYPAGKLDAGSMVREARARLYYVSTADELVQMDLNVPRAPVAGSEIAARGTIAQGVENLQIDCETDSGVATGGCPGVQAADPVSTEATWAFGTWTTGGARLTSASIGTLRSVVLSVVMRSQSPLVDQPGDDPVAVNGVTLGDTTHPYLRRTYRFPIAVRNVSLGAF